MGAPHPQDCLNRLTSQRPHFHISTPLVEGWLHRRDLGRIFGTSQSSKQIDPQSKQHFLFIQPPYRMLREEHLSGFGGHPRNDGEKESSCAMFY